MRPYKEANPKSTVIKIQEILKDIDLLVVPIQWGNPYEDIFSLRVVAIDEDGGFGTNGKGRSQLFALASAYAEYIERIQNQLMSGATGFNKPILKLIHSKTGYYYYPDEQPLSLDKFMELPISIKNDLFGIESKQLQDKFIEIFNRPYIKESMGITSVPFFDVNRCQPTYLPYNLIYSYTGSNGMAAGNTIAEATYQAMCEIFERYAASIVYYNNLTPPTISTEYLKCYPEESNVISKIRKKGFEVIVKDFSCDKRLPVIGLIIIDVNTTKYKLNIGADTSFKVALSRTITEIYQGIRGDDDFRTTMLEMPNEQNSPFFYNESNKIEQEMNLSKFMKNGLGYFPPSLFNSAPDYVFDPSVFNPMKSYDEEVSYLFSLMKSIGHNIYIRDVSFLGFPSVYIYIPEVSIVGRKNVPLNKHTNTYASNFDEIDSVMFPFDSFIHDKDRIERAIELLVNISESYNYKIEMRALLHLSLKPENPWYSLTVSMMLSMICFLVEKFDTSIYYLKKFIIESDNTNDEYYNECILYFELLRDDKSTKCISPEIIDGFKNPESLFQYIGYPKCPDCNNCKLNHQCITRIHLDKTIIINSLSKNNIVSQNKFSVYLR